MSSNKRYKRKFKSRAKGPILSKADKQKELLVDQELRKHYFNVRDRVEFSEKGKKSYVRQKCWTKRSGTIVRPHQHFPRHFFVKWDELKTPRPYHAELLSLVNEVQQLKQAV